MTHPTKAKSKTKIKYNKNLVSNYHLNGEEKKKNESTNRTDIDWWESFPTCLELIRLVDMIFGIKNSVQR